VTRLGGAPAPEVTSRGRRVSDGPGVALEHPPAQHQGELEAEELVEGEALPGRFGDGHRLGEVDGGERLGAPEQFELGPPLLGQRVGEAPGALERLGDPDADLPAVEPRLSRRR